MKYDPNNEFRKRKGPQQTSIWDDVGDIDFDKLLNTEFAFADTTALVELSHLGDDLILSNNTDGNAIFTLLCMECGQQVELHMPPHNQMNISILTCQDCGNVGQWQLEHVEEINDPPF